MTDAAQRRLLDRLQPNTARTGRVRRLLATTHNLQADFFDGDFLCTALSIAQADFTGHSGQVALQRKLAGLDYSGVLCEARAYEERPSLRTVIHPVSLRGACLHAKLVVVEYEHAVRILVGSANLTSPGYRENREVSGELLTQSDDPKKAAQAAAILRSAREVLGTFAVRAPEFLGELDVVLARLEGWAATVPAEISPVVWSDGARPLWRAVLDRWPTGVPVERIRIVSPFWCEDGSRDTPLRRLLTELQRRNALSKRCAVELFVESTALVDGSSAAKEPLYFCSVDLPGISVRMIPVDPKIAPTDLDVKVDLTATRSLHAKVLVLQSRDRALAYAGSANFTRNGFGLRRPVQDTERAVANVEAGWVFDLIPAAIVGLLPPAANAGQLIVALDQPRDSTGTDDEELLRFWPDGLLSADLTPSSEADALELTTRWDPTTPSGWTVCVPTGEEALGTPLFATAAGAATVTTPLSASSLQAILRLRHVVVSSYDGSAAFPVNVAAGEARHRLSLSPAGRMPSESDLLAYYQGRITFDDLYPGSDGPDDRDPSKEGAPRPAQGVDKGLIQAYQIREFVDALPGIRCELLAARGSAGALYQAFLGEVSPIAIARDVLKQIERQTRSVMAGAFQLVELLAVLRSVATDPGSTEVEHYRETCQLAQLEIENGLSLLRKKHAQELSSTSAFDRYAVILERVSQ